MNKSPTKSTNNTAPTPTKTNNLLEQESKESIKVNQTIQSDLPPCDSVMVMSESGTSSDWDTCDEIQKSSTKRSNKGKTTTIASSPSPSSSSSTTTIGQSGITTKSTTTKPTTTSPATAATITSSTKSTTTTSSTSGSTSSSSSINSQKKLSQKKIDEDLENIKQKEIERIKQREAEAAALAAEV